MQINKILPIAALVASMMLSCNDNNCKITKVNEALTPVSFEKVTLNDNFWLPRLQTQKKTLVPFSL